MKSKQSENYEEKMFRKFRRWMIGISIYHVCILILLISLMAWINIDTKTFFGNELRIIMFSALFGMSGSVIYFMRKCYVYLITNKLRKIIKSEEINKTQVGENPKNIQGIVLGYYCYLILRPLAGSFIGPVLYMLAVSGISTLGQHVTAENVEVLSKSSKYLIYVISFLGGHASSDMFDYFSWLAKTRLVKKN